MRSVAQAKQLRPSHLPHPGEDRDDALSGTGSRSYVEWAERPVCLHRCSRRGWPSSAIAAGADNRQALFAKGVPWARD